VDKHLNILGGLFVALGLSGLVGTLFVLSSMIGGGLATGQWPEMLFVPALGVAIALLILIFSLPTLIEGIGLLRGKAWAQRLGLFISALNLVNFPFGTPVGAYGLWVLSKK
jgi:hypothetical protein